ncbi:MAG: Gfo/Idh/MocA family oxidoreductase [Erysipelotrichaceae bacterium]
MLVAVIGTSFISEWFIKATQLNEGVECVAIYSRSLDKGNTFAKKNGVDKVYCDLDEMLANPNIDTIYVGSPNSLHFDYSLKAIQAGKHVICEKPFTTTVNELDCLIAAAKKYHVFLFEAIVTLHSPNYKMIKDNVQQLGTIRCVQCNFSQYSSRYDQFLAGENPNVFTTKFSGGALCDLNIYNLHFVTGIFGRPDAIQYFANKAANGIDTSGVLVLTYPTFQASCVACKDSKSQSNAQIQGEKGYIMVKSETSKCSDFSIHIDDACLTPAIKQQDIMLYYELADFIKIINENDVQACDELMKHSHMVMELLVQARLSAKIEFENDHRKISEV